MASDVRIFDPNTGKYRAATAQDKELVAEHEAQRDGKPAPGDVTPEQAAKDASSYVGPVITGDDNAYSAAAVADTARGAARNKS